jgi:HEAT repeat protein
MSAANLSQLPSRIPIKQLIEALLDDSTPLKPRFLYRLSDLEGQDLKLIQENWSAVPLWRRQALMEDLQYLAEDDYLLSFEALGRLAIEDPDSKVRSGGVHTLIASECESPDLIPILLDLVETDVDQEVRAISATALGRYIYLGEIEELPEDTRLDLENRLIEIARRDAFPEVQRRALESLGFSGREEVVELIQSAYQRQDAEWIASAIFAMGRSADERWKKQVLDNLEHRTMIIRIEAIRAAGELNLKEARSSLISQLDDSTDDLELDLIWALSQIGGPGVLELLTMKIQKATDDEKITFLEQALDNLAFNTDVESGLGMFYLRPQDTTQINPDEDRWIIEDPDQELEEDDEDELEEELALWEIEDLIDDDDDMDDDEEYGD